MLLSRRQVERYQLRDDEAWAAAAGQMDRLLAQTPLERMAAGGGTVLLVNSPSICKAALIAAPSLRRHVEPQLGWPVRVVVPCRDFVYLFAADSVVGTDLVPPGMPGLGRVVLRESTRSAYPLSREAFEISDSGIAAIVSFANPA